MASNVLPFPPDIIAQRHVRFYRARAERLTADIEAADPDTQDGKVTIAMGEVLLEHVLDELRMAEAEAAGTALTHNGVIYAETQGRA